MVKFNFRPIFKCTCRQQICGGRFLQIRENQVFCQWECLRLGLAQNMSLDNLKDYGTTNTDTDK